MKIYNCDNCGNRLYFENDTCLKCGYAVGFNSETLEMVSMIKENNLSYREVVNENKKHRYCSNKQHLTCNWLVPYGSQNAFCKACMVNETIPNLSNQKYLERWKTIEIAKHRLIYSILRMGLPLFSKTEDDDQGLAFHFKANTKDKKVMTGHANGNITLNIDEADDVKRTKNKKDLGEKYRTLLGHFRHEVGHYYWDLLVDTPNFINEYRSIFGDERADYGESLKKYYDSDSENWSLNYISMYASAHPWEDWAETWAHYMHLTDTLETASAFGLGLDFSKSNTYEDYQTYTSTNPYLIDDFDRITDKWIELTFAFNSVNRSMGHQDFYPFVISETVKNKLKFVHKVVQQSREH